MRNVRCEVSGQAFKHFWFTFFSALVLSKRLIRDSSTLLGMTAFVAREFPDTAKGAVAKWAEAAGSEFLLELRWRSASELVLYLPVHYR